MRTQAGSRDTLPLRDGRISHTQLRHVLCEHGEALSDNEMADFVAQLNVNEDGSIDLAEVTNFVAINDDALS